MSIPAPLLYSALNAVIKDTGTQGICMTRAYSQGSETDGLRKAYESLGGKWQGACHALVRQWIVDHAHDRDFWRDLDGKSEGAKYAAALKVASRQLKYAKNFEPYDAKTIEWFNKRGLVERTKITSPTWNQFDRMISHWSNAHIAGQQIAKRIAPPDDAGFGWYTTISMRPEEGHGHMVGAFVGIDVLFFDPNYGEFWFQTRPLFRWWFSLFYNISGYYKDYPSSIRLRQYGKRWGTLPDLPDALDLASTENPTF